MDLCIRNCGIPRPIKEFLEIPIKIEHCEVFPPPTECCWSLKSGMKLCKVRCPAYKKRRSGKPERRRMWRWRESNPRPNKEPESFLHAYPPFRPSIRVWQAAT